MSPARCRSSPSASPATGGTNRMTVPARPPQARRAVATRSPSSSSASAAHTAEMSQSKRLLIL